MTRVRDGHLAPVLLCTVLVGAPPVLAQAGPVLLNPGIGIGVHAGGVAADLSDRSYALGVMLGAMVEGRLSYTWARGLGVQTALARASLARGQGGGRTPVRLVHLSVQPTYWPRLSRTMGTFIGPRLGRIEREVREPGTELRSVARGWSIGAAVGVFGKLSRRLGFVGDLSVDTFWLGDNAVEGFVAPGSASHGTVARLAVGVQLSWPGAGF